MGFTSLAIFWMSFAAFIGPIFLIALVCSITKAIRTRKEIIKRIQHTDKSSGDPTDAEIITDNNIRRKPKIKLIEDEARKKQFRGNNGSLVMPSSSAATNVGKRPKFKDTDVDAQTRTQTAGNVNKSNIVGGCDVIDKDTPTSATASAGHTNVVGHPSSSRNKTHNHHNHHNRYNHHNRHNHHNRSNNQNVPNGGTSYNSSNSSSSSHNFNQHNSKQHNAYYSSNNGHNHVVRDTDIIVHNHHDSSGASRTGHAQTHAQTHAHGVGHDRTRARSSYEGRRRKSLGDDGIYSSTSSSSYWNSSSPHESSFQNCNGHAFVSDGAHYRGANALYNFNKHDKNINHPGLKPDSYTNRGRRHSVNSTSPTLERIPEVKAGVEVEMTMTSMMSTTTTTTTATTKSKSEDNLIDAQSASYSSSSYLSNGGRGSDNRAFARSTETTIM